MHSWNALRAGMIAAKLSTPFAIEILSGTGYAGSVYSSTRTGGNWYADETPISGATGATHVMLAENEGKSITYRYSSFTSNAIELWVPSDISSLALQFDAAAETTITLVSGACSSFVSKGGNLHPKTFAQATAANRPPWSATGRNGKPAFVPTNAAAYYMDMTDPTGLPSTTNPSVVAVVAQVSAGISGYRAIFSYGPTSGSGNRTLAKHSGDAVLHAGSSSSFDNLSTIPWVGLDRIVIDTTISTENSFIVDGSTTQTKTATYNHPPAPVARCRLMGWTTGTTQCWNGAFQEALLFDAPLSLADRQKVEGYFASKWGLRGSLAGGHPYKSTNPT